MTRAMGAALVVVMALLVSADAAAGPTACTAPAEDQEGFFVVDGDTDLHDYDAADLLYRQVGCGRTFGATQSRRYFQLKNDARVRWAVRDLETGEIIAPLDGPARDRALQNRYGASTQKSLVVASLLWHRGGELTPAQWSDAIGLIAASWNNPYWDRLEDAAGGRAGMEEFAREMGYDVGPWRRSADGDGNNQLNPVAMTQLLYDLHHDRIPGGRSLLTLMAASRTGLSRAQRYTPTDFHIGGKTGSFEDTGTNNELRYVDVDGHLYAIAVFTELGWKAHEDVAVVFGGLLREYVLGGGGELDDGFGGDDLGDPPSAGCAVGAKRSPWLAWMLGAVIALLRRRRRAR